jgi:hypothetical protein
VLRLSSRSYEQAVVDELVRMFRGHCVGEESRPLNVVLDPSRSVEDAVAEGVGVGEGPRHERLANLARVLSSAPWLIVFRGDVADREIVEDGSALLDALSKLGRPRVAALVLDTVSAPTMGDFHGFSAGWFADAVVASAERGRDTAWAPYMATRLAWEAAGDLARAEEFESAWTTAMHTGDDEELERRLNVSARATFEAVPAATRQELGEWLRRLIDNVQNRRGVPSPPESTQTARLVWQPPGDRRWRTVPWAARAMLLEGVREKTHYLLRPCLVAAPLANELIRRCFDLEAWILAVVRSRTQGDPPEEAVRRWAVFDAGRGWACRYYPPGTPARPPDAWGHVAFGDAINGVLDGRDSPQDRLRKLRNALAHGHYVSWTSVTDLIDIEAELRGGW